MYEWKGETSNTLMGIFNEILVCIGIIALQLLPQIKK